MKIDFFVVKEIYHEKSYIMPKPQTTYTLLVKIETFDLPFCTERARLGSSEVLKLHAAPSFCI